MAEEKSSFDFLYFSVEVTLTDTVPEGFREEALAGVYSEITDNTVRVWFKGPVTQDAIVHEAWHLFHKTLAAMDNQLHYFDDLNSEIYAYEFQWLCGKLLELITSMDLYKTLYNQSKEAK